MSYPRARLTLTLICFHFSHCPTIITIFYRNGTPFTNIKHIFILAKVTNGLLRLTDRFFDLISNSPVTMQISGDKPNHICKLVCFFVFFVFFFWWEDFTATVTLYSVCEIFRNTNLLSAIYEGREWVRPLGGACSFLTLCIYHPIPPLSIQRLPNELCISGNIINIQWSAREQNFVH